MLKRSESGFSLIEMAVVIIIIGLLAGGILAGRHLLRNSDLQSVISDLNLYGSMIATFQDTYYALPGDMTDATSQWGAADATPSTCTTTASTGKETCNGNGDGKIDDMATAGSDDYEQFRAWQQLVNAGLMEYRFTGVAGSGGSTHAVVGTNVPQSSFGGGGFALFYAGQRTSDSNMFDGFYSHIIVLGAPDSSSYPDGALFLTEEIDNIDNKMDDGKPASGSVRSYKSSSTATPNCTTTDVASTAKYDLSYSSRACSLIFLPGF